MMVRLHEAVKSGRDVCESLVGRVQGQQESI